MKTNYSQRIRSTGGIGIVAASATASAARIEVNVDTLIEAFAWVSFDAVTPNWVPAFDNTKDAGMRACGLNLTVFNTADFQWAGSGGTPTMLNPGDVVDGSLSYSGNSSFFGTLPADGEEAFAGYRMMNQGVSGTDTHYGYVHFSGTSGSFEARVENYVFDDLAGQGVSVIPEPAGVLLGVLGVAVLIWVHRRFSRA